MHEANCGSRKKWDEHKVYQIRHPKNTTAPEKKNNANIAYSFLKDEKGANHPRFHTWPLSRSFFTRIDSPGLGCTNETCCSSMVSCSICPLFSLRVISEGSAFWKERVASAR